jgi:peptidoglycan/xylan/chitin deacetylase (PgdA/CDA1 family)
LLLVAGTARARSNGHSSVFAPVIIMHHVKLDKPSDDAMERGLTIPPPLFAADIHYIATHGYHTISARTLVSFLRKGGTLPSQPVVLTFDDGYADMYSNVYPLLRRNHLTATFFICPGLLDRPRYLTWKQVLTMSRHGMDIEAHSMTHPDLTMVPAAQTWGEIYLSRAILQSRLHRPVDVFAYPYGSFNALVVHDVQKAGYWAAFTTRAGWWQRADELLTLPRVYVTRNDTVPMVAGLLKGG